jgi:hypothetical protein
MGVSARCLRATRTEADTIGQSTAQTKTSSTCVAVATTWQGKIITSDTYEVPVGMEGTAARTNTLVRSPSSYAHARRKSLLVTEKHICNMLQSVHLARGSLGGGRSRTKFMLKVARKAKLNNKRLDLRKRKKKKEEYVGGVI